jgi:hypothetical protein
MFRKAIAAAALAAAVALPSAAQAAVTHSDTPLPPGTVQLVNDPGTPQARCLFASPTHPVVISLRQCSPAFNDEELWRWVWIGFNGQEIGGLYLNTDPLLQLGFVNGQATVSAHHPLTLWWVPPENGGNGDMWTMMDVNGTFTPFYLVYTDPNNTPDLMLSPTPVQGAGSWGIRFGPPA